ncbi:MAG: 4Fe-4S binding protein, partial [Eubacteriaceae bacterium]|nr:4Fe-4S binding protein [Eubacteriaceae bacterium]
PVLFRLTTRICHSKSLVECYPQEKVEIKDYLRNIPKYCPVPGNAKNLRTKVDLRTEKLRNYSENTPLNFEIDNKTEIGIIVSGISYMYAREAFENSASFLKLGFTNPLPEKKIKEFASKHTKIIIIEENDPFLETQIKAMGIGCTGKDVLPITGEMTPDVLRALLLDVKKDKLVSDKSKVVPRPPALCAGCPHRGFFYELSKRKEFMIFSDIGCYSLGILEPYSATDVFICMGASVSGGHGVQKIIDLKGEENKRALAVLGDSTFFHSGMTSLLNVTYNKSKTITVILDNRITGMTGHQENPGSGYTLEGERTVDVNIETIVRALGIRHVKTIDPNDLKMVKETLDWAKSLDETSVIITRWPCVLKKFSKEDRAEFDAFKNKMTVDQTLCIGCKKCLKTGCPALRYDSVNKKTVINRDQCVGCEVCFQVCPVQAIHKEVL